MSDALVARIEEALEAGFVAWKATEEDSVMFDAHDLRALLTAYATACAERDAAQEVERATLDQWNAMVKAIGAPAHGTAVAHAARIVAELATLRETLGAQVERAKRGCDDYCTARRCQCDARAYNAALDRALTIIRGGDRWTVTGDSASTSSRCSRPESAPARSTARTDAPR